MSKDNYEENDERMNVIGQNGNEGLHYSEVEGKPFGETVEERVKRDPEFEKRVAYSEACEKIANMEVESMSVEELKQYVYEDLVELIYNSNDIFEYHAEKWGWTNE